MRPEKPDTLDCCGFKYRLGDKLRHVASQPPGPDDKHSWVNPPFNLFCVVARLAEECSGGVQLKYVCRMVNDNGGIVKDELVIHELELVPYA